MSVIADIEDAIVAHWSRLGRWPGAALVDDGGILRFETPIAPLPYNAVLRTQLDDGAAADAAIAATVAAHAARGVELMWFVGPSARPLDLGERLAAAGVPRIESDAGMALELSDVPPQPLREPPGVTVSEAVDDADHDTYNELNLSYWSLDDAAREPVARLNRHWAADRARGKGFLARAAGVPVGKAYVSFAGPPGVAGIFGMSVAAAARGRGIASAMTRALVAAARAEGSQRVVLMASEMAAGVYERAGFVPHCTIDVHATGTLRDEA